MSHPVNDMIADQAIDTVADMTDLQVLDTLFKDHGIASPIDSKLTTSTNPLGIKGPLAHGLDVFMDAKRDQLTDLVYGQLIERPGPHG